MSIKKIFRFFFITILLILLTEIGSRLYIKINNSKNTGMNLKGKSYGIMKADKELGFTHAANAYNRSRASNNMGFLNINDVVSPEKRNSEDIVFIAYGGSTTYSYNLEQNEAWPYLFQEEMCKKKKNDGLCKFSVFNGGHIMYSIGHAYKRAKRDLPIVKPDYIIIYSGFNEYPNYQLLKPKDKINFDKSINNKEYGLIKKFDYWYIKHNLIVKKLLHYKLFDPLKNVIASLAENSTNKIIRIEKSNNATKDSFPIVFENYLGVLKKFINLAETHNTKVIFLVQSQGTDTKRNIFLTSFSQKAKKKVSELGAIVIDTNEIIDKYKGDKSELFYETGVHYSFKGSDLVAKLLFNKLIEKKLITN